MKVQDCCESHARKGGNRHDKACVARWKVATVQQLMAAQGVRGDPRNYAVLVGFDTIVDVTGSYKVLSKLPDWLNFGDVVYYKEGDNLKQVTIRMVRTTGNADKPPETEYIEVTDGNSVWPVTREEIVPLGIPSKPTLIHKRDLWQYVGADPADRFWNKSAGVRRDPRHPHMTVG